MKNASKPYETPSSSSTSTFTSLFHPPSFRSRPCTSRASSASSCRVAATEPAVDASLGDLLRTSLSTYTCGC